MSPQFVSVAYLLLLIAIFYFLIILPQQRRAREHRKLVAELKVGDHVITMGGMYGTITAVEADFVRLEIAPKITVKVARSAVSGRQ